MRIGSWNVAGFRKIKSFDRYDYESFSDLSYFSSILKSLNLDCIFIQESLSNKDHSYAQDLANILRMPYVIDTVASKSFIDPNYHETMSFISNFRVLSIKEIPHVNPNWEVSVSNGHMAKAFHRKYQVLETEAGSFVHIHLLPEKFFNQNYSLGKGAEYLNNNLALLNSLEKIDFLVGDMNTVSIEELFKSFFQKFNLTNAFTNIPTRPISDKSAVVEDVICYNTDKRLKDSGVIKTDTDHYLIWAEF